MKADCATVDYSKLGPIAVAFLDVDLYLPTKQTLPKLFDALVPGGIILIDDVKNNNVYDGAYQAYTEFCAERSIQPEVIGTKCGVVRK
jgi:predicted O-methyltransferase YrrM